MLETLKNKFKKERSSLVSEVEVQRAKVKFGTPGKGRKRKANFEDELIRTKWKTVSCIGGKLY